MNGYKLADAALARAEIEKELGKAGKRPAGAGAQDFYDALVRALNRELALAAKESEAAILNGKNPFANYLSMEYLFGKLGMQSLIATGGLAGAAA
ncbi:MAG: hypothetical protein LBH41_02350, partial [Rickettsiales bacterium]|nr:hypothetical protein [Rickettsiales bacterium]